MTKQEFISAKNKINSRLYNYTQSNNTTAICKAVVELLHLYKRNATIPNKNNKYRPLWDSLSEDMMQKLKGDILATSVKDDLMSIVLEFVQSEEYSDYIPESESTIRQEISISDIRYIRRIMNNSTARLSYEDKKKAIMLEYKITEETFERWLSELGMSSGPSIFEKASFSRIKTSNRYLISSAQNASPVNTTFLNNMKAYASHIGAEIGIIATRYKNPTSIYKEEGDIWSEEVIPYLTALKQDIHKNVTVLADLKIQGTSINPTRGCDAREGHKSIIVGSPCVEMVSVPVLPTQTQKFIHSTGSVTDPNYSDTLAGNKAGEYHNYGFVIVEIENESIAHIRNVIADVDGSFNDLVYRVEDGEVSTEEVETLVWGDSHFAQQTEEITAAFRGLCTDLGISKSVLHDVWDSQAINVHNLKDPIAKHRLIQQGKNNLQAELDQMMDNLVWFNENMDKTIVVRSNHDDMLDRAMSKTDWHADLINAQTFVKLLGIKLGLSTSDNDDLIPYLIKHEANLDNVVALGLNDSYIYNGVELAIHGHKGTNGAKGTLSTFAKHPTPNIIGHSHSPAIKWNCFQVGVSCKLDHGYNSGLSGWAYAACTLNKYGGRQMIVLNKDTLSYTTLY